jgi:two-component system phosphate regulon sensor histidine kinase PhoR
MKSNQVRIAIILGSVSIIGIILFQLYWVNQTYNMSEQQFNQRVQIALYNVAEKMLAFNGHELPNENPVRQISSNYYIVDINDIIDASILDHYLKTEFEYQNLNLDYEYAIYDCETDAMVFGNYFNPAEDNVRNQSRKFQKYDEFTYYFGIAFPTKTMFIIKSLNIWIISSFVLITAIIFFAYAMYIILKQKRLSEVQKDFINNMAHEFKTPVSTIGISAEVLFDPEIVKDHNRLKNYAGIIADQNKRIENQIEKVLQLGKIEKDRSGLNMEETDLHEVINNVTDSFTYTLKETGGHIDLRLDALPCIMVADRSHLANAIYNLLDNAFKYRRSKPEITISTSRVNGSIIIEIRDNGIGIEKKYLGRIFDKFYRVPTGDVHNVKGFGIGLNYVKNIADNHKWKIEINSEPGVGTTFQIIIPALKK